MKKTKWEIDVDAYYRPDHNENLIYIIRGLYLNNEFITSEQRLINTSELNYFLNKRR